VHRPGRKPATRDCSAGLLIQVRSTKQEFENTGLTFGAISSVFQLSCFHGYDERERPGSDLGFFAAHATCAAFLRLWPWGTLQLRYASSRGRSFTTFFNRGVDRLGSPHTCLVQLAQFDSSTWPALQAARTADSTLSLSLSLSLSLNAPIWSVEVG